MSRQHCWSEDEEQLERSDFNLWRLGPSQMSYSTLNPDICRKVGDSQVALAQWLPAYLSRRPLIFLPYIVMRSTVFPNGNTAIKSSPVISPGTTVALKYQNAWKVSCSKVTLCHIIDERNVDVIPLVELQHGICSKKRKITSSRFANTCDQVALHIVPFCFQENLWPSNRSIVILALTPATNPSIPKFEIEIEICTRSPRAALQSTGLEGRYRRGGERQLLRLQHRPQGWAALQCCQSWPSSLWGTWSTCTPVNSVYLKY